MTSNTKKTLGAIGVGIVIVAVPSVLAFLDMGKISDIEAETAKHDKDANELKKKQKDLEPLRGATAAEMVTFLRKKNSLPTGREADEFVDKLAEFRQKAGIPPWEISKTQTRQQTGRGGAAAEAAGGDAIEEYKYSIKMSAQYHQLGYLLSQIEYWDRFIRVAAIKVTGAARRSSTRSWSGTCRASGRARSSRSFARGTPGISSPRRSHSFRTRRARSSATDSSMSASIS